MMQVEYRRPDLSIDTLGAVVVIKLYPDAPQAAGAVVVHQDTPPHRAAERTIR